MIEAQGTYHCVNRRTVPAFDVMRSLRRSGVKVISDGNGHAIITAKVPANGSKSVEEGDLVLLRALRHDHETGAGGATHRPVKVVPAQHG
ncbi:hypothetical protein [Streptomyces sp. cg2]|uniref:hypothetical protein n=1 Tax=Streptomyces sp. cg2 TaxID=3238799 RepID=UPI0034E2367D